MFFGFFSHVALTCARAGRQPGGGAFSTARGHHGAEVRPALRTHQREHLPELGAAEGAGAVVVELVVQVELDRLLALEPTTL